MKPERIHVMTDAQLWEWVSARLQVGEDWSTWLTGPVAGRVREVLLRRVQAMEIELRDNVAGAQDPESHERWRSGVVRLKRLVEMRLPEVTKVMRAHNREVTKAADALRDRRLLHALRLLAVQVHTHREATIAADLAPTSADMALWNALRWIKIDYSERQMSLREILDVQWADEEIGLPD